MKNVITILAILTLIAAGICFYFFFFCRCHDFLYRLPDRRQYFRILLLARRETSGTVAAVPGFPDSPQFEDLFWSMTMSNQDWYIEHILKRRRRETVDSKVRNHDPRNLERPRLGNLRKDRTEFCLCETAGKSMLAIQEFNALHRD